MQDTAVELGTNSKVTYSCRPLHMDKQSQDDQLESTQNSSVPIQDVILKTYRKRWTIETGGGEGQRDLRWWRDMTSDSWLFGLYSISNFVGYLMPNPFLNK